MGSNVIRIFLIHFTTFERRKEEQMKREVFFKEVITGICVGLFVWFFFFFFFFGLNFKTHPLNFTIFHFSPLSLSFVI